MSNSLTPIVMLNLGKGSLATGFIQVEVLLYLPQNFSTSSRKKSPVPPTWSGSLPPAPKILELLQTWRAGYPLVAKQENSSVPSNSLAPLTRIDIPDDIDDGFVSRLSVMDWQGTCAALVQALNHWLDSAELRDAMDNLNRKLTDDQSIDVVIKAVACDEIAHLPWKQWRFIKNYRLGSWSFCLPEHENPVIPKQKTEGIRFLALFGKQEGVDVDGDRKAFEHFRQKRGVEVILAGHEPENPLTRDWLIELLRDPQGWDIIFYGGHSKTLLSQSQGVDELVSELLLEEGVVNSGELRAAFSDAIARRLQLAIFNSCDGLGLAKLLTELGLATTMVMMQQVPNGVAVPFAKYFFEAFSQGESCFGAFRKAKDRLEDIEHLHPCASWIPAMFCNPTETVPQWDEMFWGDRKQQRKFDLMLAGAANVVATLLVIGMGGMGWLQSLEVKAYDAMLVHRFEEPLDERILMVMFTQEEFQRYQGIGAGNNANAFQEETLAKLLTKLEQHYHPKAIGLDLIQPQSPVLQKWMQNDRIFAVCGTARRPGKKDRDYRPPSGLSDDQLHAQVGFADLFPDSQDNVNRRTIFDLQQSCVNNAQQEQDKYPNSYSFSALLAEAYFYATIPGYETQITDNKEVQFETVVLRPIRHDLGGYQLRPGDMGAELMIRYRAGRYKQQKGQVAQRITVSEILNNDIDPQVLDELQERVVLIGIEDFDDERRTPYDSKVFGVEIHAHLVSQFISAVMDGRAFIWGLPNVIEGVGIFLITGLSGALSLLKIKSWVLSVSGLGIGVITIGFISLNFGLWMPVIGPIIALGGTTFFIAGGRHIKTRRTEV